LTGKKEASSWIFDARLSGSFTIEAAFVMPIVIFTILAVICFSIWERDVVATQARMIESIQAYQSLSLDDAERLLGDMERSTLYSVIWASEPYKEQGKVGVTAAGRSYGIFDKVRLHFSGNIKRGFCDPASFLRKCGLIQTLVKG
jgi:hypothetical protein